MASIRSKLRAAPKEVLIESAGEKVYFRKMSAQELVNLFIWAGSVSEEESITPQHDLNWKARVVAASLCDKDGKQEYTSIAEDLNEILSIDADILAELYDIAGLHCGLVAPEVPEKD